MDPSLTGFALFALVYLIGWGMGTGPLIGLLLALPFGSTAFVRVTTLGGSTPLIYTLFAIALVMSTLLRPNVLSELRAVFTRYRSAWVVACLMLLAIGVTVVAPRLFAGETVSLLPVDKIYAEFPLQPSSKNITQGGYFVLGGLVYFAVLIHLLEKPCRALITKAFFGFCIAHTGCGLIDLLAKRAGIDDVFAPIRGESRRRCLAKALRS
jgi:hypothetical protein